MLKKKNLSFYQKDAIKKIIKNKRCALWADMGLGKTIIVLTAILKINQFPVLVIAPPNVAKNVWHNEIKKWKHIKHLKVIPVLGSVERREKLLREEADIYVISSGGLKWFAQYWNKRQSDFNYNIMVIDEAGQYRGHNTTRSVIARQLGRYIPRCVMLTASPMPNGEVDLWSQYAVLDDGNRLGKDFDGYLLNYFDHNKYNHTYKIKSKSHSNEIIHRISDVTFRYEDKDYLDMPDLILNRVFVHINQRLMKQYDDLEKDFCLELDEGTINITNILVKSGKLQQFANGTVRQKFDAEDDGKIIKDEIVHNIHSEKIAQLKEMCSRDVLGNKNVIIAYSHRADREKILKAVPGAVAFKGQSALYDQWTKNPDTALRYVCHPASVGHGLNLQYGGNTIIFFGLVRSYELYEQLIGRVYRQGQEDKVYIHHILTQDTIDEHIYWCLQEKGNFQENLMKKMKKKNAVLS